MRQTERGRERENERERERGRGRERYKASKIPLNHPSHSRQVASKSTFQPYPPTPPPTESGFNCFGMLTLADSTLRTVPVLTAHLTACCTVSKLEGLPARYDLIPFNAAMAVPSTTSRTTHAVTRTSAVGFITAGSASLIASAPPRECPTITNEGGRNEGGGA